MKVFYQNFVQSGATTEIKIGDTETASFADLNAGNPISNAKMGTSVFYNGYPSATFFDEYDNSTSGLLASNYQDAIDEISSDSIITDLTLYVDGTTGDDSNDGSSWANAKKTFGFLNSASSDAIPRRIDANVTVYCRNDIYAPTSTYHTYLDGFYGSGSISVEGTVTSEETMTVDTVNNTLTSVGGGFVVGDSSKAWTTDEHQTRFVSIPAVSSTYYPIANNTSTTLTVPVGESITTPTAATIYSLDAVIKPAVYSATGTPVNFGARFFRTDTCSIPITFKYIDIGETTNTGAHQIYGLDSNTPYIYYIGCNAKGWYFSGPVTYSFSRCGVFHRDPYEYPYSRALAMVGFANSVIVNLSGSASDQAAYCDSGSRLTFYKSYLDGETSGFVNGFQYFGTGSGAVTGPSLFKNCDLALDVVGSSKSVFSAEIQFEDCTTCISLGSAIESFGTTMVQSGCTTEIKIGDTDTASFSDLNSENKISNSANGASVTYVSLVTFLSTLTDEYDNSTSGLSAVNYQDAIDELDTSVDLNNTHRTSNGTDHSYIDQDVTTTSSPTFDTPAVDAIQFNTAHATPSHTEGLIYYDSTAKCLFYYNEETEISVIIGQGTIFPIWNNSGSTISKGKVVYPNGIDVATSLTTVGLADSKLKEKSRLVGVVAHDIENGSKGYVVKNGFIKGLNTSGLSGVAYLSTDGSGDFTDVRPTGEAFVTAIGYITLDDATDGILGVDIATSQLAVETIDTNGFPYDQRIGTTLSFDDLTRTFTITPTGTNFHFYEDGDKYLVTGADSVVITDVEGMHAIYYDDGTLTSLANPSLGEKDQLIRNKPLVAYVYWNATDSEVVFKEDERHGISMSPNTHAYLHFTRGSQYISGLALGNFTGGSGTADADAQFSCGSGLFTDEDLTTIVSSVASTTGYPIYYLSGSAGDLRTITNAGFPVRTFDGTTATRLPYNEWTGSTWQLTEVTSNNNYVLMHVFAINSWEASEQIIVIMGQAEYGNISNARDGAVTEVSSIESRIPFEESILIGTVIFQTALGYTNSVNARTVEFETGVDYKDWRTNERVGGSVSSDHNSLSNLEYAGNAIDWGHINDTTQTLYGVKTFNELPQSSAVPSVGDDLVNKTYVDGNFSEAITVDTTLYVDGDAGSDSNDGSSWAQAKQTFRFLREGESDSIPRYLAADVTVSARGSIPAPDAAAHLLIQGFSGPGLLKILGTVTDEETLTVDTFENSLTVVDGSTYVGDSTKAWTTDEHAGRFVEVTATGFTGYPMPILKNDATKLYVPPYKSASHEPDMVTASSATIRSLDAKLIAETVGSPGTPVTFAMDFVKVEACSARVHIEYIDANDTVTSTYQHSIQVAECTELVRVRRCVARGFHVNSGTANTEFWWCGFFLKNLYDSIGTNVGQKAYVYSSGARGMLTGPKATYAILASSGSNFQLTSIYVENVDYGLLNISGSELRLTGSYFRDCTIGARISSQSAHMYYTQRFHTCTTALELACRLHVGTPAMVGSGVTTEIKTGENSSATFAEFAAGAVLRNAKTGLSTVRNDWPNFTLADEYDNSTSGLSASSYQDAIDELDTSVDLNTTHRTSNGTDHSYIDQDVTTSGTPSFSTVTATTFLGSLDTNVAAAGLTVSGTTISADGTDANIDITITPKGNAGIVLPNAASAPAVTTNKLYQTSGVLYFDGVSLEGAGSTGDVVGPASSTDNAVVRFDSTTGKLVQNSDVIISDTGQLSTGGEASPDVDPGGLCLQQGTNDNYIFTLKSSDVAHPMTDQVEADTYFAIKKWSTNAGGVQLKGYSGSTLGIGVGIRGFVETESTLTTTAALGAVQIRSEKSDGGTGIQSLGDTGNAVVFSNAGTARTVFQGSGDIYQVQGGIKLSSWVNSDTAGAIEWNGSNFRGYNGASWVNLDSSGGTGDVVGPASSTDNAIARFDSTTGKLLQNSSAYINDDGDIRVHGTSHLYDLEVVNQADAAHAIMGARCYSNSGYYAIAALVGSRGTEATPVAPLSGDVSGSLLFVSHSDSSTLRVGAAVFGVASENWSGTQSGMHLDFYTITDGATSYSRKLRLTAEGALSLNEISPDVDPGGICMNQGAGTDSIMTAKSSDVTHPFTTYAQTDTYFELRRHVQLSGGALWRGFTEATTAFELRGYGVTASTGDYAPIQMTSYQTDGGTGVQSYSNNSNIVGFRNNGTMRHRFKGGGDAVFDGGLTIGSYVGTEVAGSLQYSSGLQYYTGAAWVAVGDFSGPASSTDNAIVRFDGTGGKTAQTSTVLIDDNDNISGVETQTYKTEYDIGNSGSSATMTLANGKGQKITLTADSVTLTFSTTGMPASGEDGTWLLYVHQDTTAGRAITSFSISGGSVYGTGGAAPTFTDSNGAIDVLTVIKRGANIYVQNSASDMQVIT